MHALRRSVRRLGVLAMLALATLPAGSAPAAAADPLAKVPFAVGAESLFGAPSTIDASADGGTWSFETGRLVDGTLKLNFDITPARQSLAAKSGPAVLFAMLELYGDAGGDVGLGMSVPPVARAVVPACADDGDCHYSIDITVPLDELPDAIARLEREGDLIWVSADLTLVRTFGAGEWLQVLGLERGTNGLEGVRVGTLGSMRSTTGRLTPAGLFPASQAKPTVAADSGLQDLLDYGAIVEALRMKAGDDSAPIPAVDVALTVRFVRGCLGYSVLALHDELGNTLFYDDEIFGRALVRASTRMPEGTAWYLVLDAGGGFGSAMVSLGPIQPDGSGSPVTATATMDCATRTGTLNLAGAIPPTPAPTPRAPSPTAAAEATAATSSFPAAASAAPAPVDESRPSSWATLAAALIAVLIAAGVLGWLAFRRRVRRS